LLFVQNTYTKFLIGTRNFFHRKRKKNTMNTQTLHTRVCTVTLLMIPALMLIPTSLGAQDFDTYNGRSEYAVLKDATEWINDVCRTTRVQGPLVEWNQTYGTTKWDDCSAMELSPDGGYLFAGTTNANGYDDGGDCWLVKTDADGDLLWEKTYGGAASDTGTDLCCTSDGGYAIIGYTRSYGAGGADMYLIKTDANGVEQWNRTFGGSQDDLGLGIQQCADDGFILAGLTLSYGSREAWLVKTDMTGALQWEQQFCGTRPPGGYFMTVLRTAQEEYVAAGRNYLGQTSDLIVVKTTQDGTVLWEKLLGDSNCKDSALGIAATSDGSYIITGQVEHQGTEHDILLMKINSDGEELWTRNFNETIFFDTGLSVKETDDGGFLIAGEIGTNLGSQVLMDSILIKTDSTGKKEWTVTVGGAGSEGFYEATQTPDGGYIAAGSTTSYGIGSQDAWMLKFTPCENQPPDTPDAPVGKISGTIRQEYIYTTQANDPDADELNYFWDWGDGSTSGWIGPYASGAACNATHTWSKKGTYQIKVKAQDLHGGESDWATLTVTMPCSYGLLVIQLWELILQRFPHLFPLLRVLLRC
jgi:hypothetical protein